MFHKENPRPLEISLSLKSFKDIQRNLWCSLVLIGNVKTKLHYYGKFIRENDKPCSLFSGTFQHSVCVCVCVCVVKEVSGGSITDQKVSHVVATCFSG